MRRVLLFLLIWLNGCGLMAAQGVTQTIGPPLFGQTARPHVRMVTESWWDTAFLPPAAPPIAPVRFLSFPGFRRAKQKANERAHLPLFETKTVPSLFAIAQSPGFGASFDGPSESDGGGFPPDGAIAVGSSDVVVAINALIGIYDKAGNQILPFQSMSSFFSGVGVGGFSSGYGDPRVIYDDTSGRFIITDDLIDYDPSYNITDSYVLVAVSQTADPSRLWNKFAFHTEGQDQADSANTWSDYPSVGINSPWLYIATDQYDDCNAFAPTCPFSDAWIMVIGLSDLYAGNSTPMLTTFKNVMTAGGGQASAIQPAMTLASSSQEFLVAAFFSPDQSVTSSSVLNLFSINTSGTPVLNKADLSVPVYTMPPNAPQPDTLIPIESDDYRPINAVWANGTLWCAQNVASDSGTSAIVRWYNIGLNSLPQASLLDSGTIIGSGNAYYPAILPQANGQVDVVFGTSSASEYASAAYSGRTTTDPAGTMRTPVIYRPGLATYTQSYTDSSGQVHYRWGDYSAMSLDPTDGSSWGFEEYSKGPDYNYGTGIIQLFSAPSLEAAPNVLTFADQPDGSTSAAQTVQVANEGANSVALGSLAVTGDNSTEFQTSQDGCSGATLATNTSCAVSVSFAPSTTGPKDAELSFPQSIGGIAQGTIVIPVSGNSISNAIVSLSPPTLTFPTQAVGTTSSTQGVTLANTGTGPLGALSITTTAGFSETDNCGTSVNAGASCAISVTFAPTTTGTLSGTLGITDDAAGSPQTVALSGTAAAPQVTFSPTTLSFGQQLVGTTSAAQSVTLTDTGSVPLTISNISSTDSQFAETDNCPISPSTLAAGASCVIKLTFTPSSRGSFTAGLQVTDNAPNSPQLVTLTGQGIQPSASLSTGTVSFGNQNVGTTSANQSVTLTNTSQDPLSVASIAITGSNPGDFKETDNCLGTVAPTASCTINVTFSPSAAFGRNATLSVTDNAPGSPQTAYLSGTGLAPVASVGPATVTFSGQVAGSSSGSQLVTLSNNGNASLTVSAIAISGPNAGDFAIVSSGKPCSTSSPVPGGGSGCFISVTFTPTASGSRTATLNITDNSNYASGSVQTVALSGTGEDFSMGVANGGSSSASVSPGQSASYSLSVSPLGGFNQTVTLACSGAPSEAPCNVSQTSVTLNGSDAQTVSVTVSTTAPSSVTPHDPFAPLPGNPADWRYFVGLLMLLILALLCNARTSSVYFLPEGKAERRLSRALLAALLLSAFVFASCGGPGGLTQPSNPGTPAGTYALTVTGTSGTLAHSTTLTLTVK